MFSRSFGRRIISSMVALGALGFAGNSLYERNKMLLRTQGPMPPTPPAENPWLRSKQCMPVKNADKLFLGTGNGNPELAASIAKHLGAKLSNTKVSRFSDGEINIRIFDDIRGKDVFLIQPTCPPVNENLMELLLLISTVRRASAGQVTAIMPYYGYARQDRKTASRVPISAADVARLLEVVGVDRVIAMDLHCGQIQGFFSQRVPVDNLDGSAVLYDYVLSSKCPITNTSNIVVVSPDAGGVARAKKFQGGLIKKGVNGVGLAMIIKQRKEASQIERMDLVGSIEGRDCIIIDDIIDTAGTVCEAAKELKKKGAKKVVVFATHGLFSGPAFEHIHDSLLDEVIVTNTIPLNKNPPARIVQLDVSILFAEAIRRTCQKESLSAMFP